MLSIHVWTRRKFRRWAKTVFACAFADARMHKDFKKQTWCQQSDHFSYLTPAVSVLFFSIIERSVLEALVFYHKDMLEKLTMLFSALVCYRKNPVKNSACAVACLTLGKKNRHQSMTSLKLMVNQAQTLENFSVPHDRIYINKVCKKQ